MKCNLDCAYCESDLYGGHDNTTSHPSLESCLKAIDFMFAYADQAMAARPRSLRNVVLNIYGGESLHHPRILEILEAVHEKKKSYRKAWHLHITTTTNAIVSKKKFRKILPLIDEFTVSWHTENTIKQKNLFRENCLEIKSAGKNIKCVVLMHGQSGLFEDALEQITWCQTQQIRVLPRALDRSPEQTQFDYKEQQIQWFNKFYTRSGHDVKVTLAAQKHTNLSEVGRACCGGRQMCSDQNYKQRHFFVPNTFRGWSCSVNHFFLYVKQVTGEVFVNKDCKMNFDGKVGPIGNLKDTVSILQNQLVAPTIVCDKQRCLCGLCAPKAADADTYNQIIGKYITS